MKSSKCTHLSFLKGYCTYCVELYNNYNYCLKTVYIYFTTYNNYTKKFVWQDDVVKCLANVYLKLDIYFCALYIYIYIYIPIWTIAVLSMRLAKKLSVILELESDIKLHVIMKQ